jgi:hypothetical protein
MTMKFLACYTLAGLGLFGEVPMGMESSVDAAARTLDIPGEACDGCELTWVTYPAFWMGNSQPIPSVTVTGFTPGWGSNGGICDGVAGNCNAMPCKFGEGKLNITVAAGANVTFTHSVTGAFVGTWGAGAGVVPATSGVGDSGKQPVNVACGSIYDILSTDNGAGGTGTVAIQCTKCQ